MTTRTKLIVICTIIGAAVVGMVIGHALGPIDMGWTSYPLECSEDSYSGVAKGWVGSMEEVAWWQQQLYGLQCPGSNLVVQEITDTQAYERVRWNPTTMMIEQSTHVIAFVTLGLPAAPTVIP